MFHHNHGLFEIVDYRAVYFDPAIDVPFNSLVISLENLHHSSPPRSTMNPIAGTCCSAPLYNIKGKLPASIMKTVLDFREKKKEDEMYAGNFLVAE